MLAFGLPGHLEWLVLLVVALLVFGKRLPGIVRALARSIVGFRHEIEKAKAEIESEAPTKDAAPEAADAAPPAGEADRPTPPDATDG